MLSFSRRYVNSLHIINIKWIFLFIEFTSINKAMQDETDETNSDFVIENSINSAAYFTLAGIKDVK